MESSLTSLVETRTIYTIHPTTLTLGPKSYVNQGGTLFSQLLSQVGSWRKTVTRQKEPFWECQVEINEGGGFAGIVKTGTKFYFPDSLFSRHLRVVVVHHVISHTRKQTCPNYKLKVSKSEQ